MHIADIVMVESRCSLGFVDEAFFGFWVEGQFRWKELESNVTVEFEVLSPVDHSHTTAA
jgi:hypothetical protein